MREIWPMGLKMLVVMGALAGMAGAQNAASVKITLTASGTAVTSTNPILFQTPGTIAPFGPALFTVALWITPETYTKSNPFNMEIDVENIGAGGNFIKSDAPLFKSFGTGKLSFPGGDLAVATGTVSIDEGTEQFSLPSGSLQFTLTYGLNPSAELAQVTFDAAGTVTSAALQEIINQQQLAPSVKQLFTTVNGKSASPAKSMTIGLWNGTQAIIWSAAASTSSGGNWLQVAPASGTAAPASNTTLNTTANGSGLSPGVYQGGVTVNGTASPPSQQSLPGGLEGHSQSSGFSFIVPVTMIVTAGDQLILSQSGVQFQSVAGATPRMQTVAVASSGSTPLSFSTAISTLSGGNWLSVTPSSGSTSTAATPTSVEISAATAGLAPGVYFGRVDFAAQDASNSPQSVEVALTVLAATTAAVPIISPTGLVFVGPAGTTPEPQTLLVLDPSGQAMPINGQPVFDQGSNWFSIAASGTMATTEQPLVATVTVNTAGLAAGVYLGSINIQAGASQLSYSIPVIMVLTADATGSTASLTPRAMCGPTQLLPVVTTLPDTFQTAAGLPVPLQVTVVDDCGNLLNAGSVVASSGPADPSISLTSIGNGQWAGTWLPHNVTGGPASVVVTANSFTPALQGSTAISGTLSANSTTPLVSTGGVVSAASWMANAPLAPGGYIAIFGSNLASGSRPANVLPLPTTLGGIQVVLGGEALPLEFAGSGQINAIVPYDAPVNSTQQLIVEQNGAAYSLPETVVLAPAEPAVFTQDQSGKGPGAIVVVKPDGTQFLNTASTPASAGDALEIYCTGLGAVAPAVPAGSAAPSLQLAKTVNPVTVQVGGQTVTPFFAGLAPGYAGLYQVNVFVPAGITAGADIPVVLSVSGASSPPVTIAVE